MISFNDLTFYDFILLWMHVISAILYIALGLKTIQSKKYLGWNKHIYPRMTIASFGIAAVFLSELVAQRQYNIFFHLFMWLHAFNQFAEIFRLSVKYERIQELEQKLNMDKTIVLLLFVSLTFLGCGTRKSELEKLKQESVQNTQTYQKKISELDASIQEKEQRNQEILKELETKKTQLEKIQIENKKLLEKFQQEKRDNVVIKDANGIVTITDSSGNVYEIPSAPGTTISQTSESNTKKELEEVSLKLSRAQETSEFLKKSVQERDRSILTKDTKIKAQENLINKQKEQIETLLSEKKKNTERKAYPVWVWLLTGSGSTLLLLMAIFVIWKVYIKRS